MIDEASVPGKAAQGGDHQVGHVVAERYEILEVIGQGATGTVYRARDLHLDSGHELVALKAIHGHLHTDRQIFGRFRREVKILRRLEGPHLCKLLDFVEEDGLLLIALEYVDGPSLDEYLRDYAPLPIEEVVEIVKQVCAALKVAHAAGIIHRDLKPSNVLIEGARGIAYDPDAPPPSFLKRLSVRVVDFGLAKLVAGDHQGTALTEQDMIFGTPDYMSPEQVSGEELDHRCDIYAVGVILYEMVVGKVPFDTPGALTTMAAHLNAPLPLPSSEAPSERSFPRSLERVIVKALAKEPDERFATVEELVTELDQIALAKPDDELEPGETADTLIEEANTALSTTMESHRSSAIEAMKGKGGNVKVVVREAAPASKDPVSSVHPPSSIGAGAGERRIWTVAAVVAALVAMIVGIWLGVG